MKDLLRNQLFRHLDGIVVAPIAHLLDKKHVTSFLLDKGTITLDQVSAVFKANKGYLHVALHALCSQGWLDQKIIPGDIEYSINSRSKHAFDRFFAYGEANDLLKYFKNANSNELSPDFFYDLEKVLKKYKGFCSNTYIGSDQEEKLVGEQMLKHIEGIIIGPISVHLGMKGVFERSLAKDAFEPKDFDGYFSIFDELGWFAQNNDRFQFTEKGRFFAERASAYGVTTSYAPMLTQVEELVFGNPNVLSSSQSEHELHVNRKMNVWGSGGAHTAYFKVVDEIIIEIFNLPIEKQPKGILDMGCGNGAFLEHLFNVINQKTLRGTMLEEYPLILVGADYNKAALEVTRENLCKADVQAYVIWGDIGKPDVLNQDLQNNFDIDLSELLNVRTFLDHNRPWKNPLRGDVHRKSESTGAFAHKGFFLSNSVVEDSLLEHIQLWKPYVKKYGLLVIELHTVDPWLISQNPGETAVTAYDVTHGFSDQYIVEIHVWEKIMAEAGLKAHPSFSKKFPDSELATVSVNLFMQ